jgi:hypothetical protein
LIESDSRHKGTGSVRIRDGRQSLIPFTTFSLHIFSSNTTNLENQKVKILSNHIEKDICLNKKKYVCDY